ncbi:MAG TPA: hypothetical protein VH601_18650 [Bryobacteraceae bacterium]|jgi:hypothetical protein
MSTEAQTAANQANSQLSTGPKSTEGKARICLNALRHGLAGAFKILSDEVREDFDELYEGLRAEHQPESPTEILLVESMAQHYWLKQRALRLQSLCFNGDEVDEKALALYLRYQTTHERAFYKALNTFVKLRADKRKAEIGFVSQQKGERERAELNEARIRLANAKAQHLETDSDIKQTIEAPLPGHMRVPFDVMRSTFRSVVDQVSRELKTKKAA